MKKHYKTLEVKETATQKEIKESYRSLSKISHPDLNDLGQAEKSKEKQSELNVAYDVLGDPEKRKFYDETGLESTPMKIGAMVNAVIEGVFRGLLKNSYDVDQLFLDSQKIVESIIIKLERDIHCEKSRIEAFKEDIKKLRDLFVKKAGESTKMTHLKRVISAEIKEAQNNIESINMDQLELQMIIHKKAYEVLKNDYPRESERKGKDLWEMLNADQQFTKRRQ